MKLPPALTQAQDCLKNEQHPSLFPQLLQAAGGRKPGGGGSFCPGFGIPELSPLVCGSGGKPVGRSCEKCQLIPPSHLSCG